MAKRPAPPAPPSLVRSGPTRAPKVEFIIACEGKETEPAYLRECIAMYGAGTVKLRILKEKGVPLTLVKLAISERERLRKEYQDAPHKKSYGFVVWAVFDRDEHPHYDEAIQLALENNILLGISNPCFELWPYLHLSECANHGHRHQMQAALTDIMPKYHHEKFPIIDFELIKEKVDVATQRASVLEETATKTDGKYTNPTTTMHQLVKAIINNGKSQPKSSK